MLTIASLLMHSPDGEYLSSIFVYPLERYPIMVPLRLVLGKISRNKRHVVHTFEHSSELYHVPSIHK